MEFTAANGIPAETYEDLRLAVEEALVNIISYAYTDNRSHDITVELDDSGDAVSITLTDTGCAFNPLTYRPEVSDKPDYSEGGMGIAILKSLTDKQEYHRIKQHNILTVTKLYTKNN